MARRHDALIPLSHDHHHALRNARALRLAADGDTEKRIAAARDFIEFFKGDSVRHFREEEEEVFPVVALRPDAPMEGIVRILTEHVQIHARVQAIEHQIEDGDVDPDAMRELARVLRAHVRFEEDELFPAIERIAGTELTDLHLERDQ